MSSIIQSRLKNLGISIPTAVVPVANYITTVLSGNQMFVSGQLPLIDGKLVAIGKVKKKTDIESAKKAAQVCAINILAAAQTTLGTLDKIKRVVKIIVFVAVIPDFTDIPQVANGASDLFIDVFGDRGKHSRSAIGVTALPMNATVEIEAILEV